MKNNNLNETYNYINNYDLLLVFEKDASGKINKTFYTTGIKVYRKNLQDIAFKRFCSVPVVLNSFVQDAEILKDGSIFINCGSVNYTLVPEKEKAEKTTCNLDKISIDVFMDKNMIDTAKTTVNNNTVFMPVDYVKIGETTNLQEMKIKALIDNVLDGAAEKYQCCRVPAFSVEFEEGNYKIYGHIYNIENNTYLNTVLLYNSSEDFNNINPYKDFLDYSKEILNK